MSFEYEDDDFESWEGDYYLIEAKDWKGLLKLRKERAEKNKHDCYDQWRYGEALVLNKQYNEAIEFLTPLHNKYPDFSDVTGTIIDALYGLGKSEGDFNWKEKPEVLKLDDKTKKICISLLKNKRKPVSLSNIYCDLLIQSDRLSFNEEDLCLFLKNDKRFDFHGEPSDKFWSMDLKIKLTKK